MNHNTTARGKIILEYLSQHPTMPTLTLAKLIFQTEGVQVFDNLEQIRTRIKYYRGSLGDKLRNDLKDDKFAKIWQEAKFTPPKPIVERFEPYVMPKANNRILGLFDIHIPFHDENAINAAIRWGQNKNINTIILGGDFNDFYEHSKFQPDPRKADVAGSVAASYDFMGWLRDQFPNASIYFMIGNHDIRIERKFRNMYPELYTIINYHIDDVLHFSDFGVHYINWMQLIKVNDYFIGHGHEIGVNSGGVLAARSFYNKAKSNFIGGHLHVRTEYSTKGLKDKIHCYSVGCLCQLHPEYRPHNDWNHGFLYIDTQEQGRTKVHNALIEDGVVQ